MLAYQQYGDKTKTPLVMVHGFLCSGAFFKPNIQVLQQKLHIITVDLPGYGNSHLTPSMSSINDMACAVLQTLSQIGCEEFCLLGHSMGGMVALQMALLAPNRVVRLIAYATNSDGNLKERFETFAASKNRLKKQDLAESKKQICATWFKNGTQHQHFGLCLNCSKNVTKSTALNSLDAMAAFNISDQISAITCPVLIIGAALDKSYAPKRLKKMAKRMKNSVLQMMVDCAHNAHLEDVETFNKHVLKFLIVHRAKISD